MRKLLTAAAVAAAVAIGVGTAAAATRGAADDAVRDMHDQRSESMGADQMADMHDDATMPMDDMGMNMGTNMGMDTDAMHDRMSDVMPAEMAETCDAAHATARAEGDVIDPADHAAHHPDR